ncbi:hypothetical protein QNI19_17340 [Cytophagaceae bacterium DM2B3-1]|uniref:DUF4393 domain-containing protein n=2 Tax=Xanthocytophaga flava TaxID=3048013 RepID=A0ABT7CMD0_9BACT|nr:hypothetical protein [Xanthocytophaga flavus]MDJ1467640.1 hypothetical protein [Xanthocytophaga flavus]MDJ1494706.1 hypothetical protein [Xanthocytophaga flavus]
MLTIFQTNTSIFPMILRVVGLIIRKLLTSRNTARVPVQNSDQKTTAPFKKFYVPNLDEIKVVRVSDEEIKEAGLSSLVSLLTILYFNEDIREQVVAEVEKNQNQLLAIIPALHEYKGERLTRLLSEKTYLTGDIFDALSLLVDTYAIEKELNTELEKAKRSISENVSVDDFAMQMDGGTKILFCSNLEDGQKFQLRFHQFVSGSTNPMKLTGAIYLNEKLVPVRSHLEFDILQALKNAVGLDKPNSLDDIGHFSIGINPSVFMNKGISKEAKTKRMVYELAGLVECPQYVELAQKLGRLQSI